VQVPVITGAYLTAGACPAPVGSYLPAVPSITGIWMDYLYWVDSCHLIGYATGNKL